MILPAEIGQNITNTFSKLQFNSEQHEYFFNNIKLTPVTSVIEKFIPKFEPQSAARGVGKREGKSIAEVIAGWKKINRIACDLGTAVHDYAEHYATDVYIKNVQPTPPSNGFEQGVVDYWNDLPDHMVPVALELRMYSLGLGIAGTLDGLLLDTKAGEYIILDYKTNKDIFKNYNGQMMLYPFHYLLDTPYNHYQLQLSLYQILLENHGYNVSDRVILWVHADGKKDIYHLEDFTEMIKEAL